jgi:hypothetical protein
MCGIKIDDPRYAVWWPARPHLPTAEAWTNSEFQAALEAPNFLLPLPLL